MSLGKAGVTETSSILSSSHCWLLFMFPIKSTLQEGRETTFFNFLTLLRYKGPFCGPTPYWTSRNSAGPSSALYHFYTLLWAQNSILCSHTHPAWLYGTSAHSLQPVYLGALGSQFYFWFFSPPWALSRKGNLCSLCAQIPHASRRFLSLSLSLCWAPGTQAQNLTLCPESTVSAHALLTYLEHFSLLEYGSFTFSACLLPVFSPWMCTFSFPEGPRILKF